MNSKVVILAMLFLTLVTGVFSASLRLDSMTTTPSSIVPGDEVDLTLRVQNIVSSGEDSDYSYVLEISPRGDVSENNIVILDGEDNLGKLGDNEYWNAKFKLKIKEGAPSATYQLDVLIKKYLDGSLVSTTTASVDFDVSGDTFFELDATEKTIEQGESKTFDAVIRNVGGGSAGSVKVTFTNTANIQVLGTNSFYFSNIGYDEEKDFAITLYAAENLASGTYTIPVTIEYNDGAEIKTQVLEAGVLVGGDIDLRVASVETSPKEVRPGDNYVLLEVNLENAGEDAAKSITAVLSSTDFESSYSSNNMVYAGRVDSGSFTTLKFYVDVPKTLVSGVYDLDLDLSYMNLMGDEFESELVVPVFVKEKPILEIKGVEATGKAGETIEVRVEVENIGEENAEEVDIRLISDSSLPFSVEERSVYLGSVKSGDSKVAVFNVKVDKSAEEIEYGIRAFLRARGDSEVGDNNIYTYNKDVDILVDGRVINKLAVFGLFVFLVVVVGFFLRKKKSIKKSAKKE